jgi:Peptidase inhibitor family I36
MAVGVALVAVSLAGSPRPASANPRGGCPLGRICLYSDRGYSGDRQEIDGAARGGAGLGEGQSGPCTAVPAPVWSAVNRSGPRAGTPRYRLRLFRGADCQQPAASVGPEAGREDTGGSGSFAVQCLERGGCGGGSTEVGEWGGDDGCACWWVR